MLVGVPVDNVLLKTNSYSLPWASAGIFAGGGAVLSVLSSVLQNQPDFLNLV